MEDLAVIDDPGQRFGVGDGHEELSQEEEE
jgi:hypothetical protein